MTPTPEQQAIVDATFESAFKVIAFAGTGKTSTFVQYAAARPAEQMLYCAFNKSVAEEAKRKFGSNVLPKTVHSLAYAWYMRNGGYGRKLENLRYYAVAKVFHLDVYRATLVCNTVETFLNSASASIEAAHVPEDKLGRLGDDYANDMVDLASAVWKRMQDDPYGQLAMSHSGYLKLFQLSQPTIYASTILLDEAQDTNPVTLDLVRQQLAYGTKLLLCGDPYQQIYCQPTGTEVLTTTGNYQRGKDVSFVPLPIEQVRVGQLVPCYNVTTGYACRTGRRVTDISIKDYEGELVTVYANRRTTRYTPEHHCIVRLLSFLSQDSYHVYLMRKGKSYRVGRTSPRLGTQQSCGISIRCTQEGGDSAWLLSVHATKQEAALAEETYSRNYAIPKANFVAQKNHLLGQEGLDRYWKDVGDLTYNAQGLLKDLKRDIRFPLIQRGEYGANLLIRRPLVTAACNLMSGMEFMPDNCLDNDGKRISHSKWAEGLVQRERFSGTVYSLTVDDAHTYFADGILTHNSWRGAVDAMDMVDAPTALLTRSFRFGNAVAGAANKLLGSFFKPPGALSGLPEVEDRVVSALPEGEQSTVICRTNAELFRHAASGAKVHVVGEEGFSEFLDTVMQVYFLYSGQREKITLRQILFFKNFDALMEFAEERLDNELQSKIGLVLAYKDDIPATVFRIRQNLTTAAKAPRILVTGHKAKGLEWDNVELAEDFADLFDEGGKLVQLGEEKDRTHKDEINLLYVALTRAKRRLKLNHQLTRLLSL